MSKFSRGEQLYNEILNGDLYDLDTCLYFFIYSEDGAIAYYRMNKARLVQHAEEAIESGEEYIGATLGPGGDIVDPEEDFNGELNYEPIYEFLEKYANDNFINADPTYVVRYFRK